MTIALESVNSILDHFDLYQIIPESAKQQIEKLTAVDFLFKEQLEL
jgi:hypothetical protein